MAQSKITPPPSVTNSMTGFGRGEYSKDHLHYVVEMKSVNGKYLEVKPHIPREFIAWENELVKLIKGAFDRGRIDLFVRIEYAPDAQTYPSLNESAASHYWSILEKLQTITKSDRPLPAEALLSFRDIFQQPTMNIDEHQYDLVAKAVQQAIDQLASNRVQEGALIARDIQDRLRKAESILSAIASERDSHIEKVSTRYRERVETLLTDIKVNRDRIEQEIVMLVDRTDITEEIVRLQAHFKRALDLLAEKGVKGRQLDFLMQEMHRETNTVGQKSQDFQIAEQVMTLKSELEKIREQVQNVE